MKRILLVIALILLIALPIFAQEEAQPTLNWYGAFFTAYYINMLYGGAATTYNTDYYGFDLDLSFDGVSYGIEMEVEYMNFRGTSDIYWNYMYGWVNLFGGMVRLYAGNQMTFFYAPTPLAAYTVFGNSNYLGASLGEYYGGIGNGKDGIAIEIAPISGLSVLVLINPFYSAGNAGPEVANAFASMFEIDAKYKISGIGTIYAGIDLDYGDSLTTDSTDNVLAFYAAFKFTMIKNFVAQLKYENVADDGNYLSFGTSYKFDFGLSLAADWEAYLPATGDMTWTLVGQIRYVLNPFVFTVYVDFYNSSEMLILPEIRWNLDGGYLRLRYYFYMNDYSAAYDGRIRFDYVLFF